MQTGICPHLPVDTTTEEADGMNVTRVKAYATCWGARCMMWRWLDPEQEEVFAAPGKPIRRKDQVGYPLTGIDQSGSWQMRTVENRRGYCGLAGKPDA